MNDQWLRLAAVFEAAVERPAAERTSFVKEACGGDTELQRQLELLLIEAERPAAPVLLDRAVDEVVAELLADDPVDMVGTQIGPYRIEALLGVGGMGEVYRAVDTALGRDVAIKLLPPSFDAHSERVARFTREAQILASLNHPNIGAIYGLEHLHREHRPALALVLELVDGPTLADKLAHHALPVDEALGIALQIAQALETAHEQGIIHRDLKPGNIKVRPDGTVKVLDFGLAKTAESRRSDGAKPRRLAEPSDASPTRDPAATTAGLILGTAGYMAPEQARGRSADNRSDVWAFGCVLYEMFTGTPPFPGDDASQVLTAVLTREPDWARLPSTLSPALLTYIKRCLHKDPKQRIGDVQTLRLALEGVFEEDGSSAARRGGWRPIVGLTGVAIGVAVVLAIAWYATRPPPVATAVSRLQILLSDATALTISADDHSLAITPTGSHIVYVGDRGRQLFVRALDVREPRSVFIGTPRGPFVSPDGRWIGFIERGVLKKVPLIGGPAETLATLDAPTHRGATWGPDGTIVFATTNPATGLQRVSSNGGPVTILTRADPTRGEADHGWPEWLPDGRTLLFTITALAGGPDATQLAVFDWQTGSRTLPLRGGTHPRYTPSGHIVYATRGTLWAVPFDPMRLLLRGTPTAVLHNVVTTESGAIDAVVAANGVLAYVPGGPVTRSTRTLVWVGPRGGETPIPVSPRAYVHPRLSPDGSRVAAFVAEQELDVWVLGLVGPTETRVTSGPGVDAYPQWMPDGQRLILSSQRAGPSNLYRQGADGATDAERLTESAHAQSATGISPDGHWLIFTETDPATGDDVMQMALDGTRAVRPLVQTAFDERNGVVSPDGRWLAYEANDSGRFEIFVRPFSDVHGGTRVPLSTGGGTRPLWGPGGEHLFYVSPTGAVMRVWVGRDPRRATVRPVMHVKEGYFTTPGNPGRTYDIAPDGRLLMIKESVTATQTERTGFELELNWSNQVKDSEPAK